MDKQPLIIEQRVREMMQYGYVALHPVMVRSCRAREHMGAQA